ncbi:hypothetical protein NNX28_15105 [Arthrobacter sp. zg-Y859]|uniref:STAS domain-containing protein n=1 Tax=Arthrobacter jinronghuae TaxID=2964609 RepID=A0ABT1NU41_9MICC|nr:hypothetical protein [Arthrobacter jinronghuae]MCQ1951246.1 hypothetical protein [Arthrobacter jinronghuae]UWX78980.1 hypothetical protein N2K98_01805 [Arthrobacter jinronghuae]
MDHKLRVLVRLDVDPSSAVLEVTGCLTADSWRSLAPVIRKTAALVRGHRIAVDLTTAQHIERAALPLLRGNVAGRDIDLRIACPEVLPECPAMVPAGGAKQ